MMKQIIIGVGLLAASMPSFAVDTAVGLTMGTLGAGAEVTLGINENISMRGLFTTFSHDESLDADGADYEATLDLGGFGVMFDYYPFGGKFRLTTGLLKNNFEISGTARPTTPVAIGDTGDTFGGNPNDRIELSIDGAGTTPYIGLGWGSPASEGSPFGFGVDVGFVPMSPDVNVTLFTGNAVATTVGQAAIDQEEENIRKDLSEVELWPVIQLKASYRF